MFTHFAFTYGFAENQSNGTVLMRHSEGFADPLDGLRHINQVFKSILEGEQNKVKACCKKSAKSNKFCGSCGKSLQEKEIDLDAIQSCWEDILNGDMETLNENDYYDVFEAAGWTFGASLNVTVPWVEVLHAEMIPHMGGFYISYPGREFGYVDHSEE